MTTLYTVARGKGEIHEQGDCVDCGGWLDVEVWRREKLAGQ
ncbi:MAG: hypothetical protein ACSHWQ_02090 [Spongiibacteraceae bacterium]